MRASEPNIKAQHQISANEIFQRLYGTNVAPYSMIDCFKSVGIYFKSEYACIILEMNKQNYKFILPVKRNIQGWRDPNQLNSDYILDFFKLIQEKSGKTQRQSGIVEHFYQQCDEQNSWIIVHRCLMKPYDLFKSEKRAVGSMNIFLKNRGHVRNCQFKERVKQNLQQCNAVEFHDIIAVYAAYFDQMLRDLSFVPMELIQAEWNKAVFRTRVSDDSEARFQSGLPWSQVGVEMATAEVPTITLSLDLRKSTFAMQQARSRRHYAWWLETVSELAREITLAHGGIFDKFTGDGAICHFVYPEPDACGDGQLAEDETIKAATACASDLILAMQMHIANILPDLKFQSEAFGPAIGMARDMAVWSLDRDGKPVVVGQGIVNACRLNGGRAGQILLTNDLKFQIDQLIPGIRFEKHQLGGSHKEFPPQQEASCWRVNGRAVPAGSSQAADVKERVDRLWREITTRQDPCVVPEGR